MLRKEKEGRILNPPVCNYRREKHNLTDLTRKDTDFFRPVLNRAPSTQFGSPCTA